MKKRALGGYKSKKVSALPAPAVPHIVHTLLVFQMDADITVYPIDIRNQICHCTQCIPTFMTEHTTNEELLVLALAPYSSHSGGLRAFHSPANEVGMSPTEEDR